MYGLIDKFELKNETMRASIGQRNGIMYMKKRRIYDKMPILYYNNEGTPRLAQILLLNPV